MWSAIWLLLVALDSNHSSSLDSEPWSLMGAKSLAVQPATGEIAVLHQDGQQVFFFDPFLKPSKREVLPTVTQGLQFRGQELVPVEQGVHSATIVSERRLELDPSSGALKMGAARWESSPILTWGPNWCLIEIRSSTLDQKPFVEWKSLDGSTRQSLLKPSREDPLLFRAYLRGITPHSEIEIRTPPMGRRYPPQRLGSWRRGSVPEVSPSGSRPQILFTDWGA